MALRFAKAPDWTPAIETGLPHRGALRPPRRVLAVESEMTIMLDQPEVIELADRLGIAIVSLKAEEVKLQLAS